MFGQPVVLIWGNLLQYLENIKWGNLIQCFNNMKYKMGKFVAIFGLSEVYMNELPLKIGELVSMFGHP